MVTNDFSVLNKIALTVLGWSSAIFVVVLWRSGGNTAAISLTAGLPLGVLLFWGSLHVHAAAQIDKRSLTLAKVVPQSKTNGTRRAAVEHQNLNRMPLASMNRAQRPMPTPVAAQRTVARVPPIPRPITSMHDTNAVLRSPYMDPRGASEEPPEMFALEQEDAAPGYDFLDEMNYLYKPSSGRNRQTLGMKKAVHEQGAQTVDAEGVKTRDERRDIASINIDFGEDP